MSLVDLYNHLQTQKKALHSEAPSMGSSEATEKYVSLMNQITKNIQSLLTSHQINTKDAEYLRDNILIGRVTYGSSLKQALLNYIAFAKKHVEDGTHHEYTGQITKQTTSKDPSAIHNARQKDFNNLTAQQKVQCEIDPKSVASFSADLKKKTMSVRHLKETIYDQILYKYALTDNNLRQIPKNWLPVTSDDVMRLITRAITYTDKVHTKIEQKYASLPRVGGDENSAKSSSNVVYTNSKLISHKRPSSASSELNNSFKSASSKSSTEVKRSAVAHKPKRKFKKHGFLGKLKKAMDYVTKPYDTSNSADLKSAKLASNSSQSSATSKTASSSDDFSDRAKSAYQSAYASRRKAEARKQAEQKYLHQERQASANQVNSIEEPNINTENHSESNHFNTINFSNQTSNSVASSKENPYTLNTGTPKSNSVSTTSSVNSSAVYQSKVSASKDKASKAKSQASSNAKALASARAESKASVKARKAKEAQKQASKENKAIASANEAKAKSAKAKSLESSSSAENSSSKTDVVNNSNALRNLINGSSSVSSVTSSSAELSSSSSASSIESKSSSASTSKFMQFRIHTPNDFKKQSLNSSSETTTIKSSNSNVNGKDSSMSNSKNKNSLLNNNNAQSSSANINIEEKSSADDNVSVSSADGSMASQSAHVTGSSIMNGIIALASQFGSLSNVNRVEDINTISNREMNIGSLQNTITGLKKTYNGKLTRAKQDKHQALNSASISANDNYQKMATEKSEAVTKAKNQTRLSDSTSYSSASESALSVANTSKSKACSSVSAKASEAQSNALKHMSATDSFSKQKATSAVASKYSSKLAKKDAQINDLEQKYANEKTKATNYGKRLQKINSVIGRTN